MSYNRIAALRISKSLTQAELAEILDVSQAAVQSWESGTRKPSYDRLLFLADFFNVSLDYLMNRSNSPAIVIDTQKDPSPEERERAVNTAAAAVDGQYVSLFTDEEIQWLEQFVNTAIDRALSLRGIPSDDPARSPGHNAL